MLMLYSKHTSYHNIDESFMKLNERERERELAVKANCLTLTRKLKFKVQNKYYYTLLEVLKIKLLQQYFMGVYNNNRNFYTSN